MKLLSLNIRHGGGKRFEQIKSYLSSQRFDVLLLQEFRDNSTGLLIKEYLKSIGFQYAYNKTEKKQNTVLTASKKLTEIKTKSYVNDWSILITEINSIRVINIYFPQKNNKKVVFEFLKNLVSDKKSTLVAGDFNTGNNELDTEGAKFYCADDFSELSVTILSDAYRLLHQNQTDYSWYSNKGNGFRVDHVLVSNDLKGMVSSVEYDHSTREGVTDHSALITELLFQDEVDILIKMIENCDANFKYKFIDYVSRIDPFDWVSWDKGNKFFTEKTSHILLGFNKKELQKLLLMTIRIDKFNDGFLTQQLNNGNILSILMELQCK